ncbi:MAG: leucine-rich repeat protein, partial [Clostridiales bacterium]|nr:leucine-rich repeat protein [Clostridiales bacterium]
ISFASDTALTEIPDGMLEGCSRLSSVSIPDGVTTVGANAFHACTALARVSLPSSLKTLGPSAFDGCPALRTAQLRNTELETIPSRAFAGCTKLQDFSFPSGLDSIGDSAFSGCQQLEREMIIPDSVESIGSSAFKSCTSLYSVTLPQNLKILGASAFSTCTGLCHIGIAGSEENLLPQSLTVINEHTFEDCVSLASLTLPSKLSSLGDFVFSGCSKLVAMDIPGKVTTLGSSVFANCESLIRVALPQNITAIGASCFRNCSVLPEIDLPVSLSTLGSYAFQNCRLLSGIAIPSGVTALPDGIFYNCTALRTIDAPNATSAGNSAFFSCQQLTDASFAQQFTLLGESAFENCVSLTRVVLSGNLSEIKKRTFFGCSSLCGVSIPEGIGSVGERAFCNCVSLTEILFPASLKTVEVDAFKGCSSLSAVTIPEGENDVTLRSGAFSGLPKKARVYLPRNLTPVIATDVFTSGTVIWGHRLASDGTSNSSAWNCAKNHSLKFTNVDGDKYSAAISVSDITVGLGITRDAEVSIFPLGTEYTLSSSNPTVVAVEGRTLRGVSLGNADLTVTCGSVSKTAKITVSQAASSFTVPNLVLVRNSVGQISPVVSPADATTEFSYTHYGATADAGGSIVTVNARGKVTAIELGEASILVTDAISGLSKPCHITVAYSADSIVFSPSVQTLCLGIPEPVNLWVDIRDTRLRNVFSTFSSEDPTIASVSLDGIVTPHAIGQTTITAKSGSKLSAKMTLLVTTGQNLPASATTVRDEAFAGTAFTRLVVPEGYTSIGSRAFANNKALRYLALPDSLRADGIPGNMLEGCDKKKLTIVCASENSDAAKWAADNGFTVLVP